MIKKKMSLLLAAVLVASGVGMVKPAAAAVAAPKVTYVAPAITMAEVGDDFSFALQSDYAGKVQYQIWAQNTATKAWYELTKGYTELVNGKDPFIPTNVNNLPAGSYKASVWVKAEGSTAKYDSYATASFKIQKDGYFAGRAKMDNLGLKDTYTVGEAVTITGADQYKLHVFDPSVAERAKGWTIDATYETAAATADDFKFAKPGKYLVDVWGKKADSKNLYDGWTLKVVTVTASTGLPAATVVDADTTKLPMQTLVQIKLDTTTPENYKVSVGTTALELRTNAAGEKVFIGVVNGTLTADQVKAAVKVESTAKETVAFTVTSADTTKLPMQTLVQVKLTTTTPENYTVKVGTTALELRTNAAGEKVFIGVVNGTLTVDQVKAQVVVQ
ncbi:hypothetical protein CLHOM_07500 [Clostridium homopropionicum DSM 5847]|uniref:Uncharacterized protein n=1 Tax=Clostridium homopropionicum DSM 5847 TaxID=1121318 RepID=A0A0L6ZCR8_9CLOT|nr:hypothetical protein [Clostridium homopropionicum]KOA20608.1 hypothetical protein CLHOM_07500 [Clostridium homopropionicum DSM 5847]SFF93249.1 hypothetical protein SAMN04488501_103254 [Clostridium homopropionicum]